LCGKYTKSGSILVLKNNIKTRLFYDNARSTIFNLLTSPRRNPLASIFLALFLVRK